MVIARHVFTGGGGWAWEKTSRMNAVETTHEPASAGSGRSALALWALVVLLVVMLAVMTAAVVHLLIKRSADEVTIQQNEQQRRRSLSEVSYMQGIVREREQEQRELLTRISGMEEAARQREQERRQLLPRISRMEEAVRQREQAQILLDKLVEVTANRPPAEGFQNELVVNVTKDGKYVVADRTLNERELIDLLHELAVKNPGKQSVQIRADQNVKFVYPLTVIGICKSENIHYSCTVFEE